MIKKFYTKFISTIISSYYLANTYIARRYNRFHLGNFWIIFPTLTVLVGTLVSSTQLNLKSYGFEFHYTVWVILPFVVFRAITESLDITQKLLQQVFILYRSVFIKNYDVFFASIIVTLYHIALDLILAVAVIIIFNFESIIYIFIYVYIFFFGIIIGVSMGVITGIISMLIYDIRFFNKILRIAIIFCTPIFYIMPKTGIVEFINKINPFTYIIVASRDVVIYGFNNNVITCLIFSIPIILLAVFFTIKLKSYLKIINSTLVKGVVGQTYACSIVNKTPIKKIND